DTPVCKRAKAPPGIRGGASGCRRSALDALRDRLGLAGFAPSPGGVGGVEAAKTGHSAASFDYLVGSQQQRSPYLRAHRLSGLEVDHQLKLRRLLDWDVSDRIAVEEFDDLLGH